VKKWKFLEKCSLHWRWKGNANIDGGLINLEQFFCISDFTKTLLKAKKRRYRVYQRFIPNLGKSNEMIIREKSLISKSPFLKLLLENGNLKFNRKKPCPQDPQGWGCVTCLRVGCLSVCGVLGGVGLYRECYHGRPQTFFQGRAKFSRGGKNILFALKTPKNILFASKKSQKHTILAGQGGSRAPSCPPLRTPMALPCGRPWMLWSHFRD